MSSYITDFRHAARALVRARAFTAVCVTSLGLGMGVVILVLLFMKLVFGTPPGVVADGLVEIVIRPSGQLRAQVGGAVMDTWSYPDYLDVRSAPGMAMTGWSRGEGLYQPPDGGAPIQISTVYVSTNYFSTVGVGMLRGPGFTAVDDASRVEAEAVISHQEWRLRFASDPNIIGRPIKINGTEYLIVGVAPEGFRGHVGGLNGAYFQLWLPLSHHPRLTGAESARFQRETSWMQLVGRVAPGTSVTQANAAVQSAMAGLAEQHPATHKEKAGGAEPYFPAGARLRAQVSRAGMIILGLSGIVLLVVGLNISGMMLVRSAMRERDTAIRAAMGASRWRLMRYHLTEALVIAMLGGAFASAVIFGAPIAVAWAFDMWGPGLELFRPDVWVVLQCIALCFVTSLILGLLPALRFSRGAVVDALKNDSSGSGRRVGRLQRFTAAAQAGLAVPFLVICGVQFDQARVTALVDVGFQPEGLYAVELNLAAVTKVEEDRRLLLRAVQQNLAQAPGVTSASVGDGLPLDAVYRNARVAREGDATFITAHTTRVGPNYLETIGTRLLAGRTLEANDREGAERVVVLSEPLAKQLFPTGDPIGQRIAFAVGGNEPQPHTVVGVTVDLVSTQMGNPRPQLFVSLAQQPASTVLLVARGAASDPSMRGRFENAITDAVRSLPNQASASAPPPPVYRELITGEGLVDSNRKDLLTSSGVGGGAAAVALILSALGVYGVIAFMVTMRTREIGVRVALGASQGRVLRGVLGDALKLVVPGIGVGLLLAVVWVRIGDPSWYPLGGVEPLVYTFAAGTAFTVALLAGIPSARRAAAVEPMIAMRAE